MKQGLIVAAALLALGLGALVAARVSRQDDATVRPEQASKTVTPPPARPSSADPRGFVGVIFPRQQVDIAPSVSARVEDVKVQLGTHVKKGDVVATLDSASLRRELAAAVAAVRAARAEAHAAVVQEEAAAEKVERLDQYSDSVSGQERINARNQARLSSSQTGAARARVSEAEAKVGELKVLLESSALVAPFDGVIAARYIDPGALIEPGRPIARLISADDLWVRFAVPEDAAGAVRVGGCVRVAVDSPAVTAPGVVAMVAPQVDTELRMLVVEARLTAQPTWQGKLQAGLPAHVTSAACTTP